MIDITFILLLLTYNTHLVTPFPLNHFLFSLYDHQCPEITPIDTLNAPAYMGVWFEQSRVKNEWFQSQDSVCTQAYYFGLENGSFWVENSTQDSIDSDRIGVLGVGSCTQKSSPNAELPNGNCQVTFKPKNHSQLVGLGGPNYQVIDTDYDNYSIVYSCGLGKQFLWILTRDPVISQDQYAELLLKTKSLLPEFDQTKLISQEYQGDRCTYIDN